VTKVVVCDPRRNKLLSEGSKGDKARKLAELLRTGMLRSVYHGHEATRKLKELVRAYETLSVDPQRTMARIKAIYRGPALLAQAGLAGRGFTASPAAVPIPFDPMASRLVAMHRCYKTEQTAIAAVSEQMAANLDGVARFEVFALDTDPLEAPMASGFHSPDCRNTLIVLDLDVEPGMRNQIVHFGDFSFHGRPFRCVVVAVGMMCSKRQD
jgi:hypothetical protein